MPRLTFVLRDGSRREVEAPEGLSVMEAAHRFDVDIEGACGGSLACATCHVIVDQEWFDRLPPASDNEEDLLDMTFGVARTSRLSCQIVMTPELDGLVVSLPPREDERP